MTSLFRSGRRPMFALAAAVCVVASTTGALGAGAAVRPASAAPAAATATLGGAARGAGARQPANQMYATVFFSRSEITAADGCTEDDTGIARLDTTVAPFLKSLGMSATGTLVTKKTQTSSSICTHHGDSLTVSWDQAAALTQNYGWTWTSATATYPHDISSLTPVQQQAQTCGSAKTIDEHGLPGAHGLIAYPGLSGQPATVQATYGAKCFAWGRIYHKSGTTTAAMGTTAPYWQYTRALDGGPCNDPAAKCYNFVATGSSRYAAPSQIIALVDALQPGQWLSLSAYILVKGKTPPYVHNGTQWNCNSSNPDLHWTNDVERYCYKDFQQIMEAIAARGDITVTDPLTVGVAFGRPATYP